MPTHIILSRCERTEQSIRIAELLDKVWNIDGKRVIHRLDHFVGDFGKFVKLKGPQDGTEGRWIWEIAHRQGALQLDLQQ